MKQALSQTPTSFAPKLHCSVANLAMILCFFAFLFCSQESQACNRSYLTLDSTVATGTGEFDIYVTACVGAGITGSSKGAAANTHTFGFVFYSSCVPSLHLSYFPPTMKGIATGASYLGYNYGPVGYPFNAQAALLYQNPSYQPFTCVSNTSACGNVHTQCDQYRFRVAHVPDSLRVLGFEGAGNAMGGCYPDADMMVEFPAAGNPCNRVVGGIATPKPATTQPGLHADIDADHFFTSAAEAAPSSAEISLYPNPNNGTFALSSSDVSVQQAAVSIFALDGREVASRNAVRMGESMDFGELPAGSYFLIARGEGFSVSKMLVVR